MKGEENKMLEENYVLNLLEQIYNENDDKLVYIKSKIKRRTWKYLTLNEYNYIRRLNDLQEIDISKVRNMIYEMMISYTDLYKETGISRSMMSMILRGTRNTTINALNKICEVIKKRNKNFNYDMIMR